MSASKGTEIPSSMSNAQGEFKPQKPPSSDPLTTSGHQVGQKTSSTSNAPEFSAETLPAGTAPAANTFKPNPVSEIPGQADNPDMAEDVKPTSALDSITGSTSGDVHKGEGQPKSG